MLVIGAFYIRCEASVDRQESEKWNVVSRSVTLESVHTPEKLIIEC
jgi:hypothetical protein